MKQKEMHNYIHSLMVKRNTDMVALPAKIALALGIEYVTLKGEDKIQGINFDEYYVPINARDMSIVYGAVRKLLNDVHLYELTESEVNSLIDEIVFGSVYLADYCNSFGVSPQEVSDYADGWYEVLHNPQEFGEYDNFYQYIQSIEWID